MVVNHEPRKCQYPDSGYSPEYNSACTKVRKSYGVCCGPCDVPCYSVCNAHRCSGWSDGKIGE